MSGTTHGTQPHNLAARMGRWSAAHWKTATFGWLAFVLVAFGLGGAVGMKTIDPNTAGPGESGRMDRILDAGFKQPAHEAVLIQSTSLRQTIPPSGPRLLTSSAASPGSTTSSTSARRSTPATRASSRRTATRRSSSSTSGATRISPSTRSARSLDKVDEVAEGASRSSSSASSATRAPSTGSTRAFASDLEKAGLFSLPITLIILLVAFGALVAAGIPLLLGLTAVFGTFGLVALPSHVLPIAPEASAMVLLIGLAVGVDYSMFYLRRVREERAAGRSERAAIEAAAATSGHSVLVAGMTVIAAMAGMFLTGDATFASFGVATILVVAMAMLGSLTVLPALLSRLGNKVDRGRVPFVGRLRRNGGEGRVWGAIVDRVLRRPVVSVVVSGGLLVALAVPALQLRMVQSGPETFPQDLAVVKTYNRMQDAFPGSGLPANVVVKAADVNAPAVRDAIDRLEQQALASGRVHEPVTVDVNQDATVANITLPIDGTGTDSASIAALGTIRDDVVPRTVGALPGVGVRRHRRPRAVEGQPGSHEVDTASGRRVRARVRVRADARRVPLDRRRGEGDRAEPALGRRGLRCAGDRLPARLRTGPAGLRHRRAGSTRSCRCSCS